MPMLDVSAALTNPYTLDHFDVYRRKQIMNDFGEAKTAVQIISGVMGVVYAEGLNNLARRAEAQINPKSIVIISRFAMRGESQTVDKTQYQPDIVRCNGNYFLIVRVEDFSNYASGFVKMLATSIDMVDLPPAVGGVAPVYLVIETEGKPISRLTTIQSVIDGSGYTPSLGVWDNISVPFACTITGWTLTADQPGSAVIEVLRGTYDGYPIVSPIAGTERPTLVSQIKGENLAVQTWAKSLQQNDVVQIKLLSVASINRLNLAINLTVP